jgi:foldase protein PrsA
MATKKNTTVRKTTKNTAPKKSTRTIKKSSAKPAHATPVHEEAATISPRRVDNKAAGVRFKKSYAIILLAVLLLLAVLYALRGLLVAATVNGQPIYRLTIINELERQSGKQALDTMITKSLILQEAKKKNVSVSDQQIDQEIKKIEANLKQQGQSLEQVLSMQGLTRESLRDQVRIQKTVELLLGNQITVTDKEVDDYIASNSAQLPQTTDQKQLRTSISQELRQQKLSEKFQTWLANIRKNAKIDNIVTY